MKILQNKVSEIHTSAFFYDGVIAEGQDSKLVTYQDGELMYDGAKTYVGADTPKLATETDICDSDIEAEVIVDIFVDKFFSIEYKGEVLEDIIFCDYDEAINGFQDFLNKL